jgi:hypothetical protein
VRALLSEIFWIWVPTIAIVGGVELWRGLASGV